MTPPAQNVDDGNNVTWPQRVLQNKLYVMAGVEEVIHNVFPHLWCPRRALVAPRQNPMPGRGPLQ
ncbi:MAG: hypothetical protein LZF62_60064 [Nitrospira sp.]|nr:MAG: hypothetical protein LZF62_60064 [Nitrospira sp.]